MLFYAHGGSSPQGLVCRREYLGTVQALALNSNRAAALVDARVVVHLLSAGEGDEHDKLLPPASTPQVRAWQATPGAAVLRSFAAHGPHSLGAVPP